MGKTNRTNNCSTNKQQAIKNLKAVELVPVATEPQVSSFIQVQIRNCNITVTESTDMKLLRKISEAFNYD